MYRKPLALLCVMSSCYLVSAVIADPPSGQGAPAPAAAITAPAAATDAGALPTPNYSGDLWTRSTLTGDWGGARNDMARKGLTLDMYATQVAQSVVAGGLDNGARWGGRGNITLTLDTGKAGLWPGGFVIVEGEGKFSDVVNAKTGVLLPVNGNALFSEPGDNALVLPAMTVMQFLTPQFGVLFGKLDTSSGDDNAFAHGKGDRGFLNAAFCFNPITAVTVPYSAMGAGLIFLPHEDLKATFIVLDAEGRADTSGVDTVFKGGTVLTAEARYTTHFANLRGHQLIGGTYSDRLFTSVDQNLRNFIIPALPIQKSGGSWSAYYNFDQYLYQPDPKRDVGLGVFGRFGISDGTANPIHYFGSVGVGGKGLIPGRTNDQFGLGYYRVCRSRSRALDALGFEDSQGFEAYYEIAITPSILLTPDIQIVDPSQRGVDTVYVLGLRLTMKF